MNLKKIRQERGVTQLKICRRIGISQSFYSSVESGIRRPSVEVAKKIAAFLNFDWTLFYEEENPAGGGGRSNSKADDGVIYGVRQEIPQQDQISDTQQNQRQFHNDTPADTACLHLYPTEEAAREESERRIQALREANQVI